MSTSMTPWATRAAMGLFVLLWGSAALFTRLGLNYASPTLLLSLRFSLALLLLFMLVPAGKRWPAPAERRKVMTTGTLLIGAYSVCYFQAMAHGVTPGMLATLLGAQPILTLLLTERRFSPLRLMGLILALLGLSLLVWQGLSFTGTSVTGLLFSLAALVCITLGALGQKHIQSPPESVLPLQYLISLLICLAVLPFEPLHVNWTGGLILALVWLGLIISVLAQLLFYRLIRSGNVVNITSLFYLVPIVTLVLDYLIFGHALSPLGLLGVSAIIGGLILVFRPAPATA